MQWTGLNELREKYLQFFESKGHLRLPSFPLVPDGDKSLLLINSGMAPMKKWFLGQEEPPSHRVTTCQKCIRTPDIESVGITDRHGTYFEMLGNFSFQNYFKREAISWAWEFFHSPEWLDIPAEKLHISVYEADDEAYDIWTKEVGIAESHMVRLGKADNFWEHGSGPCGPCSEIYFDRGEAHGCGQPGCAPGCECDRFIEVWNLVFTEFDSDGNGHYEKLAKPNIDTGMGLERLACVIQGAENLFVTDTVLNILHHVESISGKSYGAEKTNDISIRVITDHIRSTVFMVSDGILPSNEGRGYVLRRLLRRAARHGRLLGIHQPFLAQLCDTVIDQNKTAYPELAENADYIKKTIAAEEERFSRTIDAGLSRLAKIMEKLETAKTKIIAGEDAFRLHDTFGFPLDLIREIAAEAGMGADEAGFRAELEKQRQKARQDRANRDIAGWEANIFAEIKADATRFTGYTTMESSAAVVALSDGEALFDAISTDNGEKDGVLLVLDQSPFYAESGGQVADTGVIEGKTCRLQVLDVKKVNRGFYVHTCVLDKGSLRVGEQVVARVDEQRRRSIMRNHTSAHLLQRALRDVLGEHVHQAGSYVDAERVRFDFTHFSAMTTEEIRRVENLVNRQIFAALPVTAREMPLEEAKKLGAVALFGEKYGDVVRVVEVSGYSTEFCGGTHVDNTAKLGCFKVISEGSVGAGVRRIEGTTGYGVLSLMDEKDAMLLHAAKALKAANVKDVPDRAAACMNEIKELEREMARLKSDAANDMAAALLENPRDVGGIALYAKKLKDVQADELRQLCDRVREENPAGVGVFFALGGKAMLAVCCGSQAVARGLSANQIIKRVAALAGGNGGGKDDFAMAGVKNAAKVDEALAAVPEILGELMDG